MIPEVLYRGTHPEIQAHVISNYGNELPLGPGIYTTESLKTVGFYTSEGRSVYKLVICEKYRERVDGVIQLSKKLSEQPLSAQEKIKAILREHYDFLEVNESRHVLNLLFYREGEVEKYNFEREKAHNKFFEGSLLQVPHIIAKIFLSFLKTKACSPPVARTAPKIQDIVDSLVASGIWMGVGTLEGTIEHNGAMDDGLQYLFYDENAIAKSIELTRAKYLELCKESGI